MPEKFKISNRRGRAVKLKMPLGGVLNLAAAAKIERFLRPEDAAALKNTAGVDVEPVESSATPELAVAEAVAAVRTKTTSRDELHAASKAGSAAKSKPDKKPATTGDDE